MRRFFGSILLIALLLAGLYWLLRRFEAGQARWAALASATQRSLDQLALWLDNGPGYVSEPTWTGRLVIPPARHNLRQVHHVTVREVGPGGEEATVICSQTVGPDGQVTVDLGGEMARVRVYIS